MDCLPATQSAISTFYKASSKIERKLAHFLRPEGTGEAYFRSQRLIYARFSLSRIEPVPLASIFLTSRLDKQGQPSSIALN